MEHKYYTNLNQIPKPKPFVMSPKLHFLYLGFVVIGVLSFTAGLHFDADRAWHSYLLNYFFWLQLSLAGVFFVALHYITSSRWSAPLRRVPESFVCFLPVALVLTVILFFGMHSLYEWTHASVVQADAILKGKTPYLNFGFFAGREVFFFVAWIVVGFWMVNNSVKQDATGNIALTKLNMKIAAPFIVFFGVSFTIISFDWMMSLEPHWFSTIFGLYCFGGLFFSGLAMMTLFVILLRKQGPLAPVVNENHLQDLGKLMFAFCVFWTYIAFSQYMLIWYGNLPEETTYLIRRTEGAWTGIALALLFAKFVIPFFLLIGRDGKRNENYLLFVCVWVLAAQWFDCYWMIYPMLGKPVFGWQEIGIFLGMLGLFVLSVSWFLQRVQPVPMRDPRLLEATHFHQ